MERGKDKRKKMRRDKISERLDKKKRKGDTR